MFKYAYTHLFVFLGMAKPPLEPGTVWRRGSHA